MPTLVLSEGSRWRGGQLVAGTLALVMRTRRRLSGGDVDAVADVLVQQPYLCGVQGLHPLRSSRVLPVAMDLGAFFADRLMEGDPAAVEHGRVLGEAALGLLERRGVGCRWHGLQGRPGWKGVPGPAVPVTALVHPETSLPVLELRLHLHLRRPVSEEAVVAALVPLRHLSWSSPAEIGTVTSDRIALLFRPQPWFMHRLSLGDPHAERLLEGAVASTTALLDHGRGGTVERVERKACAG